MVELGRELVVSHYNTLLFHTQGCAIVWGYGIVSIIPSHHWLDIWTFKLTGALIRKAGGSIQLPSRLVSICILSYLKCLTFKYITTQLKWCNLYTKLLPWDYSITYTDKKPGQLSYLLGQYISYTSVGYYTPYRC